ncbi:MAG: hypothetical protein GX341_08455 [Firmicutes bacterium]|nr:hypothetical protein [Bacillota bacterium]
MGGSASRWLILGQPLKISQRIIVITTRKARGLAAARRRLPNPRKEITQITAIPHFIPISLENWAQAVG